MPQKSHIWIVLFLSLASGCGGETSSEKPEKSALASGQVVRDIAVEVGLDFVNFNGMSGKKYFVEMTGQGGGLLDYDNDGDLDVYLSNGYALDPDAIVDPDTVYKDRLFRNDLVIHPDGTRDLSFTDVTEESGIEATEYGMGVAVGDINNDGHLDLYVTNWGPNQMWLNNGDLTFTNVTQPGVTDDPRWSTSATFFDFDKDGWLDLMAVNYVAYQTEHDHKCFTRRSGQRDYCGPMSYDPEPDLFLRNLGDGTFEDVTFRMGMAGSLGAGLAVLVADFNEDGWSDVLVGNDGMENRMWINQQGDRFEDQALFMGTALNQSGVAEASMGVTSADFDNDGDEDLFMTHLKGETNTFYVNMGGGLFDDRTRTAGLGRASVPFTAFGNGAFDFDNDGWLDIYTANGEVRILPDQVAAGDPLPIKQPNLMYRNLNGTQFEQVPNWGGALTDLKEVSRGLAFGDIDNDGAMDILMANNNGPARLWHNEAGQGTDWIGLHLLDISGKVALGTRVELVRRDGTSLWRRSHTDGSYCASKDPRVLFGMGQNPEYEKIRVIWSDGSEEEYTDLRTGTYHTIKQGQGA